MEGHEASGGGGGKEWLEKEGCDGEKGCRGLSSGGRRVAVGKSKGGRS